MIKVNLEKVRPAAEQWMYSPLATREELQRHEFCCGLEGFIEYEYEDSSYKIELDCGSQFRVAKDACEQITKGKTE